MTDPASPSVAFPVVELRQYTLLPGRRDDLISLFDREFLASQDAVGCQVLGQFRDLDDPDRYVWFRGFGTMADRPRALAAFYDGPVWQAHRDEANATLVDSDDVLLLRSLRWDPPPRVARPEATYALGVEPLDSPTAVTAGLFVVAELETDPTPNNFPRLPLREGESVRVWLARLDAGVHREDVHLPGVTWLTWLTPTSTSPLC